MTTTNSIHQPSLSPSPSPPIPASYGSMAAHVFPYYQQNLPMGHVQQHTSIAPLSTSNMPYTHQQQLTQQIAISSPLPTRSSPTSHSYPYNDMDPQSHCQYFYRVGFLQGQFSDTTVSIPRLSKTFRLHSLVLSRSPYLYRCLVDRPSVIELTAPRGPTIAAYDLIFSHLYRPLSHSDIHYLAAGNPPLYLQLLSVAEDLELDGLKMTLVHVLASSHLDETWAPHLVPYLSSSSDWIKAVDTRLLDYLTRELPRRRQQLDNCFFSVGQRTMTWIGKHRPDDGEGWVCRPSELSHIYAALPVPYLKRCLERLPVQDALQRYQFAKQVLQQTHNGKITLGLRFTKQHGMVVIVMQTPRRKRGTWDPTLYDTYE